MNKTMEKGISDIVGCLTDPIIVFPGGWGDTIPGWLKTAITLERLEMNMRGFRGEKITGTDAESCAYLYTTGLTVPMDHDWGDIYLYVATKTYRRWRKNDVPTDVAVESISDYQLAELDRLKGWLYQQRICVRAENKKAHRGHKKEEMQIQRKAERPVLFEF